MYGLQDVKKLEIVDPLLIQQQCSDSHAACGEDSITANVLGITYESIQENGETFLLVIQKKKRACYVVILLQAVRKKTTKDAQAKIQLEVLIASNRLPSIQAAEKNKLWNIFSKKEGPSVTKNY